MVAVYTGHGHKKQTQNLASSVDRGRTLAKFAGNPVLDIGSSEFRDPKVFRHEPTGRWVMATVLADERKVRLWGSADLKSWEKLSDFGPAGSAKGVWECPELFEAPVEGGGTAESRWVLKVNVNDGAPYGGSGGQYFVGRFDGKAFHPEETKADAPRSGSTTARTSMPSQSWNDAAGRPSGVDRLDEQLAICQRHPDLTVARVHDDPADGGPPTDAGRPPPVPVAGRRRAGPPANGTGPSGPVRSRRARSTSPRKESRAEPWRVIAELEPGDAEAFGLKVRRGPGRRDGDRRRPPRGRGLRGPVPFRRGEIQPPLPGPPRGEAGYRPIGRAPSASACWWTPRRWRSLPTTASWSSPTRFFPVPKAGA